MHVISRKPFKDAAERYPNQANALDAAYKTLNSGHFPTPTALKAVFPSLDNFKHKDKWWVIDIGGNHLRLMAFVEFSGQVLYVKHIVTPAEYDKLCAQYAKESKQ